MFVCDRGNCVWGNVSRGCVYECSELWRFVFSGCVGHGSSRRTVNDNGASQVMTLRTLYWEFQAVCVLPERKDRFAWGYVCKEYSSQPRAGLSQAEVYRTSLKAHQPTERNVCVFLLRPSLMNNVAKRCLVGKKWKHSGFRDNGKHPRGCCRS